MTYLIESSCIYFYVLCSAVFKFTLQKRVSTETVSMPIPADCSQEAPSEFRGGLAESSGARLVKFFFHYLCSWSEKERNPLCRNSQVR